VSLNLAAKIGERVMRGGGKSTVAAVAEELNVGVGVVRDIARRYGIVLGEGVHPVLALSKVGPISGFGSAAVRNAFGQADGGFVGVPGDPAAGHPG
jgi:hypothetical protein